MSFQALAKRLGGEEAKGKMFRWSAVRVETFRERLRWRCSSMIYINCRGWDRSVGICSLSLPLKTSTEMELGNDAQPVSIRIRTQEISCHPGLKLQDRTGQPIVYLFLICDFNRNIEKPQHPDTELFGYCSMKPLSLVPIGCSIGAR